MRAVGKAGPLAVIAALGILLTIALAYNATAVPAGWSGDTQLTNTAAMDRVPSAAVDSSGNIHIIYAEDGLPYYAKISPAGAVVLQRNLTGADPGAFETGIAVDPLGRVHLVWQDGAKGNNLVYEQLNDVGGIAVHPAQITFKSWTTMPDLAVDSNGNPSIVYGLPTYPGSVGYTKLDSIGKTVISQKIVTETFVENWGPAVAVDPLTNVHIAWSDGRNGTYAIYYSKLDLNGRVLVNDSKVSGGGGRSTNPLDMALDSKGNIYIAWVDDRDGNWEIYYAKLSPNGNIVTDDTRLTSDNATSWKPNIAVGPDDDIHIVWEDARDGNKELYYKRLDSNGTVLVDDTRLTYNLARSINPDVAVDSTGVVHVVWEQDGEVFYKRSVP